MTLLLPKNVALNARFSFWLGISLESDSYKNEVTSYHYQQSKKSHAQGDPQSLPSADPQLMMEEDDE